VLVGPITGEKLTELVKGIYSSPESLKAELRRYLKPGKLERAKTYKVSSTISLKKKGKVIVFKDKGKTAHAKIGRRTKIYVGKKKVKRKALKADMNCEIVYFGEMSQAKTIKCR
jgi:hypothetical protein